jgi:transcriptional regulator with XRE-family HTH domain
MRDDSDLSLLIEAREAVASGRAVRLRQDAGLSQREVARAVGVTPGCITRWELGERRPTGAVAVRYGRVLREIDGTLCEVRQERKVPVPWGKDIFR